MTEINERQIDKKSAILWMESWDVLWRFREDAMFAIKKEKQGKQKNEMVKLGGKKADVKAGRKWDENGCQMKRNSIRGVWA